MDNLKVAAVIVTYNNISMLQALIDELLKQTRAPEEIIVIDNASSDDTEKILNKLSCITYVRIPENTGSAGGYYEGIKAALDKNSDLILTLDDDVRMPENSMEELINGFETIERVDKLIGAVRGVSKQHEVGIPARVSLFAWRGTLIKSSAIREVGLPISEYFIYGEDLEYAMRLSAAGYSFYCIPASKVIEDRIGGKRWHKILGKKHFFYDEDFRLYYAFRNEVHIYMKYKLFSKVVKMVIYGVKVMIILFIRERLKGAKKMKAVIDGLFDGFRARLGKNPRYLPAQKI